MSARAVIRPGNEVWFHDHPATAPCTSNCYQHADSEPAPATVAHFLARIDGELYQVEPLTKPHREQACVRVRVMRDGSIETVHNTEILRSYR